MDLIPLDFLNIMHLALPDDEDARLQALRGYEILDTQQEAEFDDFTALAAHICGTPVALISLIDEDRQWFKSKVGMEAAETPRDQSFCAHALHHPGVFTVPDSQADARFADNPLVTSEADVRFYAGAPLLTEDGHALGTLCVIDHVPRALSAEQERALQALSRQVIARLELRRQLADRRKAERELRASEALKATILRSALDCIITINQDGQVMEWNPAAEVTFGYRRDKAIGRELAGLILPHALREALRRGMARYLETGEGLVLEKRIEITAVRSDGSELPIELAIMPILLEGSATVFTATLRDISERKNAQEALRVQAEQYRLLFENATHGIYRTTPDGQILLANPALLEMLGYDSLEQLAARNLEADETEAAYARDDFKAQLEAAGELRGLEATWTRRDGRLIFVRENAHLVRDARDAPLFYEGSVEDITAKKEAEESLRRAHDELEARVDQRTAALAEANRALSAEVAERQQMQARLAQALQERENIMETVPDILFRLDLTGRLVQWNRKMEVITGLSASELQDKPSVELFPTVDRDTITRFVRKAFQSGYAEIEGRLLAKAGAPVLHQFQGVPLRDAGGRVIGLTGTGRDITEDRRQQAALAESEQRYRSLVEHSPDGIVVYSDSRLVYLNAAAVRLFGAETPAQLLGRSVFDVVHPDWRGEARECARLSQHHGQASRLAEFKYLRLDGSAVDVEAVSTPILFEGRPAGQVLIRDITERRRAEEQVRATNDMRQLIIDNIPQFIFWKDQNSVFLGCNENFAQAAGLESSEEIIGKTDFDLPWKAEEAEGYRAVDAAVMRADAPQIHFLETQRRADGRDKWLETNKIPLHDAQGRVMGILGTFQDVTERRQSEEQIRALNAELFQAYDATIEGWSRALDYRDHETEGHSRRVTELTLRLARALGVGEKDLVHVRRGALLHDIGKMAVPDSVLLKPGPLDEAEWEVMRRHPAYAHEMLAPVAFLRPALDIPRCHHEKWDGSGYPDCLRGEQIPLAARLFAVVDVWDALRSDRPYRKAWDRDRVLDHVRGLSGTHFDPQVVRAFLALMVEGSDESSDKMPLARATGFPNAPGILTVIPQSQFRNLIPESFP